MQYRRQNAAIAEETIPQLQPATDRRGSTVYGRTGQAAKTRHACDTGKYSALAEPHRVDGRLKIQHYSGYVGCYMLFEYAGIFRICRRRADRGAGFGDIHLRTTDAIYGSSPCGRHCVRFAHVNRVTLRGYR
jgi:hypothetical protein